MATRKNNRTGASDKTASETEAALPETPDSLPETVADAVSAEAAAADSPDPAADAPEAREAEGPVSEAEAPASEHMELEIDPDRPADAPGEVDPVETDGVAAEHVEAEPADPEPVEIERAEERQEAVAARDRETAEDYAEEEHGSSFAAKALTWLVLLLAGAGLGIWAAPKIAPSLPSGMAPVAAWLSPGQNAAEARIAELETRLDAGLSDVGAQVAALDASGDVEAALASVRSELEARIAGTESALTELRDTVSGLDGAETRQRLGRVEAALEGQVAELAGLKDQLTAGGTTAVGAIGAEQVDLYRSQVEGLRAEMGAVSDSVSVLSSRIDEVAATADRSISAAQLKVEEVQAEAQAALDQAQTNAAAQIGAAEAQAGALAIATALAAGQPFAEPVATLAADPEIAVPDSLAAAAETGAPTVTQLRDSFPDAAHAAIRAGILASAGDGVLNRSRAFLEAQVATRSLTPQQGLGPDAVLSRMEDHLRRDDLSAALAEAEALPADVSAAMAGWLGDARRRLDAEAGMEALRSSLPTVN